jgi:hypothetical protein
MLHNDTTASAQKPPATNKTFACKMLSTTAVACEGSIWPSLPTVALGDLTRDRLFSVFQFALLALPVALPDMGDGPVGYGGSSRKRLPRLVRA